MIDQLGPTPLFVGVESEHWALSDFIVVARDAKALGISCLLIKIADGGNLWYDAVGGWQAVLSAISQQGMRAVPYTYCYGNLYGAIQTEVNILIQAMRVCGIVVADMEQEFNGQTSWASAICTALKPVAGTFGVTSWANPDEQNWTGVLQAIVPCTDFFLPQVYTDYLAGRYQSQYSAYGIPVYPTLYLGTDLGPNNLLQNAQNAHSPTIALWEYQSLSTYASIVSQIVSLVNGGGSMQIPNGWRDDGHILTAPNGIQVTDGFRQWVLTHNWSADNLPRLGALPMNPVEQGNPALGGGTVQPFNRTILVWTSQSGVYEMFCGKEWIALYQAWNKTANDLRAAQAQIQTLQQQLQAAQNGAPDLKARLTQINDLSHQLESLSRILP